MKSLKDFSYYTLQKMYEEHIKSTVQKNGLCPNPTQHTKQGFLKHDFFSVYAYGDMAKVVYIKNAPKIRKNPLKIIETFSENLLPVKDNEERISQSISRTKAKIFEIAMCNEFTFFCTFTLDENKRDRFDLKSFRKDFTQFIRNENKGREEKIKYLLIPEQHKNGAWHMHGLFMGFSSEDLAEFSTRDNIPLKMKKQIRNGEKIYNWARYQARFGFFSATEIRDSSSCSKYITKYISKDLQESLLEKGEHLFFASQGLKRREEILKNCEEKCFVDIWDFENEYVKIKYFNLKETD